MNIKNTSVRYGLFAIVFHWLLTILIIGMLSVGLYMTSLESSPEKFKLYGWHKEFGILVLTLVIIRLLWRVINITPRLLLPQWEKMAAIITHWTLYALMIAMPLTGWLLSSAANRPVSFFGWITLPNLISPNKQLQQLFGILHEGFAYLLIALIILHILAALKHHLIDKDDIFRRILP